MCRSILLGLCTLHALLNFPELFGRIIFMWWVHDSPGHFICLPSSYPSGWSITRTNEALDPLGFRHEIVPSVVPRRCSGWIICDCDIGVRLCRSVANALNNTRRVWLLPIIIRVYSKQGRDSFHLWYVKVIVLVVERSGGRVGYSWFLSWVRPRSWRCLCKRLPPRIWPWVRRRRYFLVSLWQHFL